MPPELEIIGGPMDGGRQVYCGLGERESFIYPSGQDGKTFHKYIRNGLRWEYHGSMRLENGPRRMEFQRGE